jgi:hypothetical protein
MILDDVNILCLSSRFNPAELDLTLPILLKTEALSMMLQFYWFSLLMSSYPSHSHGSRFRGFDR